MAKKIISFIVILLVYCTIGASVIIATDNYGMGFAAQRESGSFMYAYALDRAGGIYYIRDSGGAKSLVSVDSTGKRLFEKKLESADFGESFYVGGIYVEHDKSVYVTVYGFDPETRFVTDASVHMFLEDGSYYGRIFSQKTTVYPNSAGRVISALSEDDTSVYFSFISGDKAEVFTALKNNSEPVVKTAEYSVAAQGVCGWYTSPAKELYAGGRGGITVYSAAGESFIAGGESAVFDGFWNGISSVYALDSASGSVYAISDSALTSVVNGSRVINAESGLCTKDMSDIAVGITGNILGTVRGETTRLYAGSFTLMSQVTGDSTDMAALINSVLTLAATAAAVILMSVLTWDFYCSILRMRLSILLRQSLLIAMLIFVSLYSLSFFVIIPQVESIVKANYAHEAGLIANSFMDSMTGTLMSEEGEITYAGCERYLTSYGEALGGDSDHIGDIAEKPQISLLENRGGRLCITASGELYPEGCPADRLAYDFNLSEAAAAMTDDVYILSEGIFGEQQIMLRKIELPMTANDAYICVATSVSGLSDAVAKIQRIINISLVGGGVVLIVFFMIIENITAGAVRKLKRSVDKIAAGQYNAAVEIHTGDEIEELSGSVRSLAAHIVDKTTSLERLNNSYYRFVPLSFLSTLGETKIERVSKSLHTKREMTVLFLRFNFAQSLASMESEDIFENINSVFEQIIPVVNSHDGTAYNFLFNGFNAIFSGDSENVLQAAIKIREIVSAFNEAQRTRGKRTVDVRIVISRGEVLLGFIGDEKRMEPAAVSTVINHCEEMEGLCADSGLYIVCADDAFSTLPRGRYRSRCIGRFRTADGETHRLYDMFDSDPYSLIKLKEQMMTKFELGVNLFEKKDFVHARGVFMDIVKYASDDGVARNYMYLAEHNITAENKQLTYTVYNMPVK